MSTAKVDSVKTYGIIYALLLGFMTLTVVVWKLHLGTTGTVIAMIIAGTKATLVVLFFMHVRHASKLTWIFASAAFLWLGIMIALTFNDYLTRANTANSLQLVPKQIPGQVESAER
jgi:cytochrome c oxidase subunit IV